MVMRRRSRSCVWRCAGNAAAALSLPILVVACALWVRSFWHNDRVAFRSNARWYVTSVNRGQFVFLTWVRDGPDSPSWRTGREVNPPHSGSWDERSLPWRAWFAGFGIGEDPDRASANAYVVFPMAYPVALAAVPLVIESAFLVKRRRSRREGFCHACAYDLCATPERCPECGRIATPPMNPPVQRTAT